VFVIEVLPWNDVHRLVRQCPPGEDDGSCNEELDDCVRPEPTSCECSQVTGDERTEWEEDKETNGAKNGMSFDLEVEANQLASRELDGLRVDHVEESLASTSEGKTKDERRKVESEDDGGI